MRVAKLATRASAQNVHESCQCLYSQFSIRFNCFFNYLPILLIIQVPRKRTPRRLQGYIPKITVHCRLADTSPLRTLCKSSAKTIRNCIEIQFSLYYGMLLLYSIAGTICGPNKHFYCSTPVTTDTLEVFSSKYNMKASSYMLISVHVCSEILFYFSLLALYLVS